MAEPIKQEDKYSKSNIRWYDKGKNYDLIFSDAFTLPGNYTDVRNVSSPCILTDLVLDMRDADKNKAVHVYVNSWGGEVAALCTIMEQLMQFKHRIGINLGTACSCGWLLFFACRERFVSPVSQLMYHEMSTFFYGKSKEMSNNSEYTKKWMKELLKLTDTEKVLTPEELQLGETSEVWLTGADLIERGAARDYSVFLKLNNPVTIDGLYCIGNNLYQMSGDEVIKWRKSGGKNMSPTEFADFYLKSCER